MDVSIESLEDLILAALKSEIESKEAYTKLAEGVANFMLKNRLNFLAEEEEKHRVFVERLYKKNFPDKKIVLPEENPVPLPQIKIDTENMPLSEILESAMQAEIAARDFYTGLADRFDEQPDVKRIVQYIASMEMGHYKILENERDNTRKFEDYDSGWPMMHVGP